MSRGKNPKFEMPDEASDDAGGIEIAYNLPFEWGNIVVTQEADRAYGLANLGLNLVMGPPLEPITTLEGGKPRVDIFLAGPSEGPGGNQPLDNTARGLYGSAVTSSGVVIKAGFPGEMAAITQKAIDDLELWRASKSEQSSIEATSKPIDRERAAEILTNYLLHQLSQSIEGLVRDGANEWYARTSDEKARKYFNSDVVIGRMMGTAAVALFMERDGFNWTGTGVLGTFVVVQAAFFRERLKGYFESNKSARTTNTKHSQVLSQQVGRDFRLAYCTNDQNRVVGMFNPQNFEEDLESDSGDN